MDDTRWMEHAKWMASHSKDLSTKIGCVIIAAEQELLLAAGYNRFPSGFPNNVDLGPFHLRPAKYTVTIHAEMDCIAQAAKLHGGLDDSTLYSTMFPCSHCAPIIAQAGIKTVVAYPITDPRNLAQTNPETHDKWIAEAELARDILTLANVNIRYIQ